MTFQSIDALAETFAKREITVGVIGLGYVGLPLVLSVTMAGYRTLGFDIDPNKIDALYNERTYLQHIPVATIKKAMATNLFNATTDFSRIGEVDAIIICVPTPLTRNRDPDVRYVVQTSETIARHLRPGQLVVLGIDDLARDYPGSRKADTCKIGSELRNGLLFLLFLRNEKIPGTLNFRRVQSLRLSVPTTITLVALRQYYMKASFRRSCR